MATNGLLKKKLTIRAEHWFRTWFIPLITPVLFQITLGLAYRHKQRGLTLNIGAGDAMWQCKSLYAVALPTPDKKHEYPSKFKCSIIHTVYRSFPASDHVWQLPTLIPFKQRILCSFHSLGRVSSLPGMNYEKKFITNVVVSLSEGSACLVTNHWIMGSFPGTCSLEIFLD